MDGNAPPTCGAKFSSQQFTSPTGHRTLQHTAQRRIPRCLRDMTGLRAVGVRALVHVEIHTTKIGDKAWEGKLCGFSPNNSTSYHIHNDEKGIVVEIRNAKFIETPWGVWRTQEDERHHDELAGRAYTIDVMGYTSFLGPLVLSSSREPSRDEVEKLREEIESMVRDSAAQHNFLEEGGTSTADASAPSHGVAHRENIVTRSGHAPTLVTRTSKAQHSYAKELSTTSSYDGLTHSRTRRSAGHTLLMKETNHISSFNSFDHAAGNPDYKSFSDKDKGSKTSLPNHAHDAIKSPQRNGGVRPSEGKWLA